uniref:Poly [ADP-ribose] polymerase n=1 Tax=Macrostomum lignano TaxID=282301 RepID=A0A1I8I1A6_9PLAT
MPTGARTVSGSATPSGATPPPSEQLITLTPPSPLPPTLPPSPPPLLQPQQQQQHAPSSAATGASSLESAASPDLFEACRAGDLARVKRLLAMGHSALARDPAGQGSTPLHFASGFGRRDVAAALLQSGAPVNARDEGGLVPLHNACSFGHCDVVNLLLDSGADPNLKDNWGYTPLHEAAAKGKLEACLLLLQRKADPSARNAEGRTRARLGRGDYRKEEILEASRSGNEEIMRLYLTPINVNCHAGDGRKSSPLHLAAGYNRTKIIRLLLQHGADVHAKDKGGLVPLHNACSYGHYEVAELLLQAGASVHAVDLWQFTPLHEAASKGRAEVCALLLAHSADPFHANCHGKTPADLAPTPDLRDRLMRDYKGCCLYNAVLGADSASVKKLITPDLLNYRHPVSGDSLLHACAACATPAGGKRRQIGESLLRKGCQLGDKNRQLQTPLHVAASRGHMDVLELLLKLGAKPNSPDRSGHTPLHAAAGAGHTAACRLLLAYGADPTVHSLDGHSADSVAAEPALAALLAQEACRPTAAPIVAAAAATAAAAASPPSLAAVPTTTVQQQQPSSSSSASASLPISPPVPPTSPPTPPAPPVPETRNQVDLQLLEAAKSGDLDLVTRLVRAHPEAVNCRDLDGRHSTPLHFAAGYNRLSVVEFLLQQGADVHAKDKGGLVPLHNACSYGHAKVAELLLHSGASVNVTDLWKFTPLHEAAAKGKFEICKLLLRHGADPAKKNRDGCAPIDLVKDTESDIYDLLRGDQALLESAKKGNLAKVQRLVSPENISCRDTAGRNSTPLHLAAGYNNYEVAEYLLAQGAEVNAQDRGGLIPLHNASSYGHVDIAALLVRHGADVNAVDKWGYSPLHEAAQKGRTQVCALLLAHGANVCLRNHEGQTALELCSADDARALLMDAMPLHSPPLSVPKPAPPPPPPLPIASSAIPTSDGTSGLLLDAPASPSPVPLHPHSTAGGADATSGANANASAAPDPGPLNVCNFLRSLHLDELIDTFEREKIGIDVLVEMGHEDLKEIGVSAFGHRHRILKGIERLRSACPPAGVDLLARGYLDGSAAVVSSGGGGSYHTAGVGGGSYHTAGVGGLASGHLGGVGAPSMAPSGGVFPPGAANATILVDLADTDPEFQSVEEQMQSTYREHRDNCGGVFSRYAISKVQKVRNQRLWERYSHRRHEIADENAGNQNERLLFHGSPFVGAIVQRGFDERHAYIGGMFGAGIYFAENSSKSNQYVYGIGGGTGCPAHRDKSCYQCARQLLVCRVCLGKSFLQFSAMKVAHAPPGHHSIIGRPSVGGLSFAEYVIYRGEQAYPEYLVTYHIVRPDAANQ